MQSYYSDCRKARQFRGNFDMEQSDHLNPSIRHSYDVYITLRSPMTDTRASEPSSTRAESVVDGLRTAILAGQFQPGERLHEVKLTTLLGVSRTPVRAALQKLASEGLLDYTPNRGYTLREFSLGEVINAYEVRAVLEGLAARLSAERGLSESGRDVIGQALRDGDDLLRHGHLLDEHRAEYGRINAAIHETIHAAAGSRLLSDMASRCRCRRRAMSWRSKSATCGAATMIITAFSRRSSAATPGAPKC
jgi:DNA-binding GntR family transcriptional regulator